MAVPSVERETTVYKAKLAEQAERYDDMVIEMTKVAKMEGELTANEMNLLLAAYKNASGLRRASWRILSLKLLEEGLDTTNTNRIVEYRKKVEKEMSDICGDILVIIDDHLIPNCNAGDPAANAYYFKMKGDFFRYLAEIRTGDERTVACDESIKAYETAIGIARAELAPTHPVRLSVALNFAVFYYEILSSHDRAFEMAKKAFDEAMAGLDDLDDEEAYKDTTLLMQILRDNMILWKSTDGDNAAPPGAA